MRKRLLLIALMLSIITLVGFKSVAASTECDRWLQQYKEQLANYTPVKHVRRRIHRFLHPRPRVVSTSIPVPHLVRPKLSPAEMLRRFHILCGDLPPEEIPFKPALLVGPPFPPPFTELTSSEVPPNILVPPVAAVTPVETASNSPGPGTTPTSPITPPFVPTGPGIGGVAAPPTGPGQSTPVIPPVPEPASLVLLLTGFAAILCVNSRK
jgi:hypothetical protein